MNFSVAGLLLALVSFLATFVVARALATWLKRRQSRHAVQDAGAKQSRQVRRAKQRAGKRP